MHNVIEFFNFNVFWIFDFSSWNYFCFEHYVLQYIIIFSFFNLVLNKNILTSIFYIFFYIISFGVLLCLFQMDLFTAFLWLSEFVVVFVFMLFSFYFDPFLKAKIDFIKFNKYRFYLSFISILIISLLFNYYEEHEFYTKLVFKFDYLLEDFYESLHWYILTDLEASYYSYYYLNSLFMVIFAYFLLIGSLICINLNKYINKDFNLKINNNLSIFNFYKNFTDFFILRNQNLNNQTNEKSSTRVFKKSKLNLNSDNFKFFSNLNINSELEYKLNKKKN